MSCFNIHFPYEPTLIIPGGGGGSGEANTASNVGGEVEVFKNKLGVDLQFRSLEAGDGITLTQNTNTVLIESTGSGKGWDAEEVKTDDQPVAYSGGTSSDWVDVTDLDMTLETDTLYDFEFHVLAETDNVGGYSDTYTAINVDFTGTYNTATWNQIDKDGTGNFHNFDDTALTGKGINAGENQEELTIIRGRIKTTSAGTLKLQTQYLDNVAGAGFTIADDSSIKVRKVNTFTNFQPSVGEANTGVNLGGGSGLYASKSGVALQFKSLKAGTNITLNETATEIEIVASGGGGGLTYWTESEYIHNSKTGTKWTPDTVNTNQDIVLQPKGTGSILAQEPDGTTAGGDNRGNKSIDFQLDRFNASEVVTGGNAVGFGVGNTVAGSNDFVAGTGINSDGTGQVGFGQFHSIRGQYNLVVGYVNDVDGQQNTVNGQDNFVDGSFNLVNGRDIDIDTDYSTVNGLDNNVDAVYSTVNGRGLLGRSPYELIIGQFNSDYTPSSAVVYNANDRAFTIGNGTGTGSRSNAFVVYKSGAVEINEAYTLPTADGTAGQVLQTDGSGNVSWATVGGGGGSTTLSNVGVGTTLVNALAGSNYPIKSIAGGGDTAVSTDGSTVTITTNTKTLTNVGGGNELVKTLTGDNYPIRTIIAGSGITVTENTNDITISASGGGLSYWTESEFTEGTNDFAKFTPTTGTNKGVAFHTKGTGNSVLGSSTNTVEGSANVVLGNSNTTTSSVSNSHIVGAGNSISGGQYNAIFGGINLSFTTTGDYNVGLGGEDNDMGGTAHHAIMGGGANNGMTGASHYSGMYANNDSTILDSEQAGIIFSETSTINAGSDRSVIIAGHNTSITAGRTGAVAIGQDNTNSGNNSFTAGKGLLARSFGEMVVGAWNTDYTANSTSAHNASDRAFTVGIGSGSGSRANGLTVYKSGAVEINEEYTLPNADGTAGQVLTTDGAGGTSFGVGNNIVLIEEQTVTGSATSGVDFSSLDLSDYYKIEVISEYIKGTHTDDTTVFMRINDEAGADYEVVADGGLSASGTGSGNNQASVGKAFQTAIDAESTHFLFSIINPGSTDRRKKWSSEYTYDIGSLNKGITRGRFEDSLAKVDREAAVTKISFFASTGNLDVGTTFKLIGYRHQS